MPRNGDCIAMAACDGNAYAGGDDDSGAAVDDELPLHGWPKLPTSPTIGAAQSVVRLPPDSGANGFELCCDIRTGVDVPP